MPPQRGETPGFTSLQNSCWFLPPRSCRELLWAFPPRVFRTSPLGGKKSREGIFLFFFFFLNPLLHVASENQTCPTEWLACSVNICEILSREQPFTEDQDSYDDPDGGLFAIKVIITPVEEFLLCAPPVSEHLIFVFLIFPRAHFIKVKTRLSRVRSVPWDIQLYSISLGDSVLSEYRINTDSIFFPICHITMMEKGCDSSTHTLILCLWTGKGYVTTFTKVSGR